MLFESILFLVPSLQERNYNQRIDDQSEFSGNHVVSQPAPHLVATRIFHPPRLPNQQILRLARPIVPNRIMPMNYRIKPNKLRLPYIRRETIPFLNQNLKQNFPFTNLRYVG